jgi:hypothetical protein
LLTKYITEDLDKTGSPEDAVVDSIHVQPQKMICNGTVLPGQFATAIINDGSGKLTGVMGKLNFSSPLHDKILTLFP